MSSTIFTAQKVMVPSSFLDGVPVNAITILLPVSLLKSQLSSTASWMEEQKLLVSGNRNRTLSEWQSRQTWPGQRQHNVAKAWKRGVFRLHAGQCVCGLKMNKLIGRTSHRLCTFSTSIREIREIKYYFNI